MAAQAFITLDLGTTRLKVAAFDPSGALLALRAARHREHSEGERRWQSADEWWGMARALIRDVLGDGAVAGREIAGVSITGRAGAAVFVDDAGAVIADPWADRRHDAELRDLVEWRKGGANLSNYAAALLSKCMYLRNAEPSIFKRVRHALYAKDFLMYRLTGEAVTDWTTGPDGPEWDDSVLAYAGGLEDMVPRVALPWDVGGYVSESASEATGLPAGIPVAVGAHDGICANVGAGSGTVGAYAITLGTHAVVRAVSDHHPPGAYRFYVLPEDRHIIGGNAVMGGRAADWFLDTWLGGTEDERRGAFETMDAAAGEVPPGSRGVRFLPFLAGQVAPEARPGASAVFAGLHASTGRDEMYRAVLEGSGFAIRAIFEQVRAWCGDPTIVRLTGGGAQSGVWAQILADILGWPLQVSDAAVEGRGAAIYLAVALGLHADADEAAAAMVPVTARIEPDAGSSEIYDRVYEEWQVLSEATRPLDT